MLNLLSHPDQKVKPGSRQLLRPPPIAFLSLSFSIGIWIAQIQNFPFVGILLVTLILTMLLSFLTRRRAYIMLCILNFVLIGVLFGTNHRTVSSHDIALSSPEGRVVLEGTVVTVPEMSKKGKKETLSFVLQVDNFYRGECLHRTGGKVQVFLHNAGRTIEFGERLRLRGTIEIPKQARNPYTFDYADYLARQGVAKIFRGIGRFSVLSQKPVPELRWLRTVNRFRVFLKLRLAQLFPSPYQELANALLIGFRKDIPREIQDSFIRTGTAHLLAISGLNISLVGGLFYFAIGLIGIPPALRFILTMGFLGFYTLLAGANFPVLRAGIMGVGILLGLLLGQERNIKNVFFLSLFLILVWNPGALFLASFQLSYVAMASLIFILPKLEDIFRDEDSEEVNRSARTVLRAGRPSLILRAWMIIRRSVGQTVLGSVAVTLGMFPILAQYFHLFSLVGFLANIVAVPVCTLAIAITFIALLLDMTLPILTPVLSFFALMLYRFELSMIQNLERIPFGYFYVPSMPWILFFGYYGFLIAWILAPEHQRFGRRRPFCLAGFLLVAVLYFAGVRTHSAHLMFFDLGKSDSALITFSNGAHFLINTGRNFPSDQFYWIVRPYLMGRGVQRIDVLLLTAVDGAHAGGLRTLSRHLRLGTVCVPKGSTKTSMRDKYIGTIRLKRLQTVSDGTRIDFGGTSALRYVDVLANAAGEILALEVVDQGQMLLYVVSVRPETFQMLERRGVREYAVVFLPYDDLGLSKVALTFLGGLSRASIVLNLRGRISDSRARLASVKVPTVHFLEESGAVEFYRIGDEWKSISFLASSSGPARQSKIQPAL